MSSGRSKHAGAPQPSGVHADGRAGGLLVSTGAEGEPEPGPHRQSCNGKLPPYSSQVSPSLCKCRPLLRGSGAHVTANAQQLTEERGQNSPKITRCKNAPYVLVGFSTLSPRHECHGVKKKKIEYTASAGLLKLAWKRGSSPGTQGCESGVL